jgi:hypothetical protein
MNLVRNKPLHDCINRLTKSRIGAIEKQIFCGRWKRIPSPIGGESQGEGVENVKGGNLCYSKKDSI